ncbi:hypothetical protein [Faecalicatena orotica]|uniref:hypothetical protein n=1 Tax=Faecalicatena orotica TaxID=1544 RepID=UPI003217C36F
MDYLEQKNWERIMSYLPEEFHFKGKFLPREEHWDWHGNIVHMDAYRNPDAKVKIILFHGVGTNGRQMTTIIGRPLAKKLENGSHYPVEKTALEQLHTYIIEFVEKNKV